MNAGIRCRNAIVLAVIGPKLYAGVPRIGRPQGTHEDGDVLEIGKTSYDVRVREMLVGSRMTLGCSLYRERSGGT